MTRGRQRAAMVAAVLGVISIAVLFFSGVASTPDAARISGALLTAIAGAVLVRSIRDDAGTEDLFDRATRPEASTAPIRPPELVHLEQAVRVRPTAHHLHTRLRGVFREIAIAWLERHRRIDLDVDVAAAKAALGDDLYDLVRPGRPAPTDRSAPGLASGDLVDFVTRLERL
jgi:hypothetical protein